MQFLAAAASKSASERLSEIPVEFWIRLGLGIVILVGAVILLRKLAKVNKVVLGICVLLVLSFLGFTWIYERNEPAWATPVVQWLANYFPTKGTPQKGR
jgi:hypothetical protein